MSRTHRDTLHASLNHRRVAWRAQYERTAAWVDEMKDEGYEEFLNPRTLEIADHQRIHPNNDYRVSAGWAQNWIWELLREYNAPYDGHPAEMSIWKGSVIAAMTAARDGSPVESAIKTYLESK